MDERIPNYIRLVENLIAGECASITVETEPRDATGDLGDALLKLRESIMAEKRRSEAQLSEKLQIIDRQSEEILKLQELKTRFLRTVTHDLRAPLGGIAMAAELLLEPDPDWGEEERRSFIQDIIDQCHQLMGLINGMQTG